MLNVCFDECAFGAMRFGLQEETTYGYYGLCYGPIRPEILHEIREKRINTIYGLCSEEERAEILAEEKNRFADIINAAQFDKELRIWYANNAADKCGLYHLAHALQGIDCELFVVEMPSTIGFRTSTLEKAWGEAEPDDFDDCLPLSRKVDIAERELWAKKWDKLVNENSILRIIKDGEVTSVPADYLDEEILSFAPVDDNFPAGYLQGITLGRLAHYITCGYVNWRIEELIKQGKLIVIERNKNPEYWNRMILRKA